MPYLFLSFPDEHVKESSGQDMARLTTPLKAGTVVPISWLHAHHTPHRANHSYF